MKSLNIICGCTASIIDFLYFGYVMLHVWKHVWIMKKSLITIGELEQKYAS